MAGKDKEETEPQPIVVRRGSKSIWPWKKETDGSASFLRAARAGNLDKVLEFLKASTDINTCNANGLNALHLASKEGHAHVVSALIEKGANVDSSTKKGNTALHIASLAGQEEIVRILVESNASVNIQSQNGFTPLYMAAQENHDSVVKYLLSHGANQSLATEDGFTPLAVALQQGHDKVVAVLLENDTRGKVRLPALHIAAKKDDTKAATLLLHTDHNPDVTSKSGFTPLHIASHYGNDNIAALLIQRKADVNFVAKHQITPLHVASKWGKGNMVSLLIDKGANIESKTRDGLTPLHCAARSGHETVVDMLLEKGAPITAKTKNGLAPLHMSSQGDHVDAARILLYHKAPVDDVTVDFLTALHVAAHCGHVRVAKLLLDRKADPNARALNGFTPLHIACKKNRIKVVELLLKHGASIEATTESGLTPLHVASFMGCMNIVIYLIQHGASADIPTVRGETPLHLAARANQTDIIRILLRNGAEVDARAREQQTALHIASRLGNSDIVVLLLQHGANVDAATKDSYTPLHIAAKEGQEEVASVLLEHGASLSATTKKGFTPLHLAAKYGNMKVARLLLQKDAAVDPQGKNGVTPLHVAAHYDHQNVALLLLDKGASPHATAKNGYTPLHIAARKNQMDIATTLLEYGASSNAESKAGFTPLHLSAQEGHSDMSTLLMEHGASPGVFSKNGLTPLHLCSQEDRVNVGAILVKNGAEIDPKTKAGYTPLHVAAHFGQMNMVRFLLQHGSKVDAPTQLGYTSLHQAAQQGHTQVVNLLLENKAEPNMETNDGKTALSIAQRLGYISVVETLKIVTETRVTTNTTTTTEEKYKVVVPETMHETFMSESEDEGADDTMLGDQSYRYLTVDEMKSLGDDSLPIDVTRDEKMDVSFTTSTTGAAPADIISPQHKKEHLYSQHVDNVDISRPPVLAGPESLNTTMNTTMNMTMEEPMIVPLYFTPKESSDTRDKDERSGQPQLSSDTLNGWEQFLVSFMVDARGGAMRGCRHSGVRVIIPPRKAAAPMRITCRYLKKDKLVHAPPLMEGEALASRILEMGPSGAKFLGPVIIEVPHFASLRGKEREIVILRSDNGETWREHTLEATEEAVQEVLNESFDGEELKQLEDLNTNRITRVLTTDFPQYFAIVTRIRQEVHAIGPEGGMVSSTVVPQVQAVFPQGALTKKIKVGLQAQPISPDLVAKLLGNRVAVSSIVTVEPRRRKFHKPITLTIPVPQAASKGMINQYSGEAPTLRLLCSITGGTTRAQWEDVTGSTPLTFVNDCVSFTTTVSARFWLMDCTNIPEATKMATELYREAIHVPFMAKFVVFSKRHQIEEARVRVFCMTDDKEDKTLETQENFSEVAKSRDVEVLEGKSQYLEFAGNLIPVTKSGDQLGFNFYAFKENRLPFTVRVKDQNAEPVGRLAFMRQPKVGRGDPPQNPICTLNLSLPENVLPEPAPSEPDLLALEKKYTFLSISKTDTIHKADLRLSDISNMLGSDWVYLANELDISDSDTDIIKSQYPNNAPQQAIVMLRLWMQTQGNKATGNSLEKGLRAIGRVDIVDECISNLELVTDDNERAVANKHIDQPKDSSTFIRDASMDVSYDEKDIMKDAESAEEEEESLRTSFDIRRGRADLSPTYESEERKYAAEEKIIQDQMEGKVKETSPIKEDHRRSSGEKKIPKGERMSPPGDKKDENKFFKEEKMSSDTKFEKSSSQTKSHKIEEVSKEKTQKSIAEEMKSLSKEEIVSSLLTTTQFTSSEPPFIEKSEKRSAASETLSKKPKEELLQKLGEELGILDEKLEEKFKKHQKGPADGMTTQASVKQMDEGIAESFEKGSPIPISEVKSPPLQADSSTLQGGEHGGIEHPPQQSGLQVERKEDVGVVLTEPKESWDGAKLPSKTTSGQIHAHPILSTHTISPPLQEDSRLQRRHERTYSQASNIVSVTSLDEPFPVEKTIESDIKPYSERKQFWEGVSSQSFESKSPAIKSETESDTDTGTEGTVIEKTAINKNLSFAEHTDSDQDQPVQKDHSYVEVQPSSDAQDSDDISLKDVKTKKDVFEKEIKRQSSEAEESLNWKRSSKDSDESSIQEELPSTFISETSVISSEFSSLKEKESSTSKTEKKTDFEKVKQEVKSSKEHKEIDDSKQKEKSMYKKVISVASEAVTEQETKENYKKQVLEDQNKSKEKSVNEMKDGTVTKSDKQENSKAYAENTHNEKMDKSETSTTFPEGRSSKVTFEEKSSKSTDVKEFSESKSFHTVTGKKSSFGDSSKPSSSDTAESFNVSFEYDGSTKPSDTSFSQSHRPADLTPYADFGDKMLVETKVEEERRTIGDIQEILVREITTTRDGDQEQRVVKETKTQETNLPDGSTVKTTSVTTFTTNLDKNDSDYSDHSISRDNSQEKASIFRDSSRELSEGILKQQIKSDIFSEALHSKTDEISPERKILSPEELKFIGKEVKILASPIHLPEENVEDVVWEVSQQVSEGLEPETVQDIPDVMDVNETKNKLQTQQKLDLSEEDVRKVAEEIVEEVKSEALKRSPVSAIGSGGIGSDDITTDQKNEFFLKCVGETTFSPKTSDKIEKYIQEQQLDEHQLNLIESVASKKAETLQRRLGTGDYQLSLEITDEDLKSSAAELSPLEHQMERLRLMTEDDDPIRSYNEPSEADESESSLIIHDSIEESFTSGYDQANQMFNKTLDALKTTNLTKVERTIDTISEESVKPEFEELGVRKKSIEELTETAKQIIKEVTDKAIESDFLKHVSSDSASFQVDPKIKIIKDDALKHEKSLDIPMESSMTESVEECSAAESTRAYDAKFITEMAKTTIPETCEQEDVVKQKDRMSQPSEVVKMRKKSHVDEFNRRSGTDFDTYSSSGESHYFTAAEGTDSRSVSRPCSSDADILLSATPGTSEYDTALTSQEGSQYSSSSSRDFSTAPSSISSRDSMKSVDSESSGHLGSIELSSEASETLVPSTLDLERDMDLLDKEILEEEMMHSLSCSNIPELTLFSGTPKSEEVCSIENDSDESEPQDDAASVSPLISSKMKRSMEMTFHPEPKPLISDDVTDEVISTGLEESTISELSADTVIEKTALETSTSDTNLSVSNISDNVIPEMESKSAETTNPTICRDVSSSGESYLPSAVTIMTTAVPPSHPDSTKATMCTQVTSEDKDDSFFRTNGLTEIEHISELNEELIKRLPDAPTTEEYAVMLGTVGSHSMSPESFIIDSSKTEVDQFISQDILSFSKKEETFCDENLITNEDRQRLSSVDPYERPRTPEPGSRSHLVLQSSDDPEDLTEVDKQFSAIFSVTYEEPESPAPFRKISTNNVPDITITEHMAPVAEMHRYPDLESEAEFPECFHQYQTMESSSSQSPEHTFPLSSSDLQDKHEICMETNFEGSAPHSSFESFEFVGLEDIGDIAEYQRTLMYHEHHMKDAAEKQEQDNLFNLESPGIMPSTIKAIKLDTLSPSSSDSLGFDDKSLDESAFNSSIEEQRRWLEMQFEEGGIKANYEFPLQNYGEHVFAGPLEDIEEERDEFERRDLSHVTKTPSLSSTPEYDVLAGRRFFTRSGDNDDISMSSLQEFESLEKAVEGARRSSSGSQDSLNGKNLGNGNKSIHGDDISVSSFSSLNEFERLENECLLTEHIENKVKMEEQILSEIEEGHESQVSESESCETISEAEGESPGNYEQKIFEIDEIIRQAQTNVENFEKEGVSLKDIVGISVSTDDRTPSVEPQDSLEEAPHECKQKFEMSVVASGIDAFETQTKNESVSKKQGVSMSASIDSLESARRDLMVASVDSLGRDDSSGREGDISSGSERISHPQGGPMDWSTDSLEPSSSQATHATGQYETDSMMSGSFASGCSNTLVLTTEEACDIMSSGFYLPEGEFPDDLNSYPDNRFEWRSRSTSEGIVREVMSESSDPEYSHTLTRTVALPPQIEQVTFRGPDAQSQLDEYIKKFNAGEHVTETETVDSAGNVHVQKVVQKRIIIDPNVVSEHAVLQSTMEGDILKGRDELGNVKKVVGQTVLSTQSTEIDKDTGEPVINTITLKTSSTSSSHSTTTPISNLSSHPCGPLSGLHSSREPLPTSLEPNTASEYSPGEDKKEEESK